MLFFSRDYIEHKLSMQDCIPAMEEAFRLLHDGPSFHVLRKRIHLPGGVTGWGNLFSLMPCYYDEKYFGAKVFSVFPDNSSGPLPTHQGLVMLFDSSTGSLLACADAHAITEIRTGATSALATKLLSREDSEWACFIGAGTQARSHLESIMTVRNIKRITIYNRSRPRADSFAEEIFRKHGLKAEICETVRSAAYGADIICTATTAGEPVISLGDVATGTHINAVGACAPCFRELSTDLLKSAAFFGDWREAIMSEPGDFLIPLQEGAISEDHLAGDLSQIVCGEAGRRTREEITIFKSVGIGNEDVAAIRLLYERSCSTESCDCVKLSGV